jgi:hypothetical protein
MEFRILGPLEVWDGGGEVRPLRAASQPRTGVEGPALVHEDPSADIDDRCLPIEPDHRMAFPRPRSGSATAVWNSPDGRRVCGSD